MQLSYQQITWKSTPAHGFCAGPHKEDTIFVKAIHLGGDLFEAHSLQQFGVVGGWTMFNICVMLVGVQQSA